MNVDIENYELETSLKENELVDLFGILIDNMLEGSPKLSECYLTINSKDQKLMVTTRNEGPKLTYQLQEKLFSKGYTTKQSYGIKKRRGFGLYNLSKLVEEYNGTYYVINEYT